MAESRNRSSGTGGEHRSRAEGDTRPRGTRSRSLSAEELRELAEELEEHGRALLARARELQRMAGSASGSAARGADRGERSDRGERTERRSRGERGDRAERGERATRGGSYGTRRQSERRERGESSGGRQGSGATRAKRDRDAAPDWAPKAKRKRT